MSHPWESRGEKRAIVAKYEPPDEVMKYLLDMQDVIRRALEVAYEMAISDHNREGAFTNRFKKRNKRVVQISL